jgi:hypothetical protein
MERPPRIWVLLGQRKGDNSQVLALADALGLPYEAKTLRYNLLRLLNKRLLGATFAVLTGRSRRDVAGPPPDLVIAIGHRSVPVVRALKKQSGGRMRAVHLGNPRVSPRHFDLLVTTPQYPVADAPNVVRNPVALGVPANFAARGLKQFQEPLRLVLLGGPTTFWRLDWKDVEDALTALAQAQRRDGGSVVVLGSPRTPPQILASVRGLASRLEPPAAVVPPGGPPSYPELLGAADQLFVTGDSVSMVSEALATGKPVGIIPVRRTLLGRLWIGAFDRLRPERAVFPRDLRRFWAGLERAGLAGTVEEPRRGAMPDVLGETARRVRALLGLAPGA